jgi:beta-glucosidase
MTRLATGMRWGVGIEDTAIGVPISHSGRKLDEFELTGHDARVHEDLELAASLGGSEIRYGPAWYRVNPAADEFRWELVDPAIERAVRLGLDVIVDLVHYGVPAWIRGGFLDPAYPDAIVAYAGAFAERYRGAVSHFTPLNEPTVTATFCGETGGWPPYGSGERGWTQVAIAIADGMQRTIAAIRSAQPEATIVHVEAAKVLCPATNGLHDARRLSELRAWLPTDLVVGRVDGSHPLVPWLLRMGADESRLDALLANAASIDIAGVNYYPQYSTRELVRLEGRIVEVAGRGSAADLIGTLRAFAERYGRPVAVTETSFDGSDRERTAWLRESTSALGEAVGSGLDLWGYIWWPLFDFVDWGIAMDGYPLEDFFVRLTAPDGTEAMATPPPPGNGANPDDGVGPWLRRMGLWRLEPTSEGLERVETATAGEFRSLASGRPAKSA